MELIIRLLYNNSSCIVIRWHSVNVYWCRWRIYWANLLRSKTKTKIYCRSFNLKAPIEKVVAEKEKFINKNKHVKALTS